MILDFERDIHEMESKIEELKQMGIRKNIDVSSEIKKMEDKLEKVRTQIYNNLTTWQRVQIARHPDRPYTMDYIRMLTTDFQELHGDRKLLRYTAYNKWMRFCFYYSTYCKSYLQYK